MDPLTLLMLGGTAANMAGSLFNRPQQQRIDVEGIMARMGDRENRYVNSQLGRGMSATGQNMAAQGIHGGAAAQVMGQIEAPLRSESLGRMQDKEAELLAMRDAAKSAYKQQNNQWLDNLLGDLGKTAGMAAGGIQQSRNIDKLGKIDDQHLSTLEALYRDFSKPPMSLYQGIGGNLPGAPGIGGVAQGMQDFTTLRQRPFNSDSLWQY